MSILTYNSIVLPLPYITTFRQEAVYEESQTDWYVTRYTIGVQCVLNVAYMEIVTTPNGAPMSNPAQIMNTVREMLLKPRKTLSFMVNGVEMIPGAQGGLSGTVDAQNGPQPRHCNLSQLTPTSFLLDYQIVAHYWENSKSDGTTKNLAGNAVLYNRWSERVEFNEYMLSKRIRHGELRIRSDNLNGLRPDTFRPTLATLSVPHHFIRESSRYELSKDGLTLGYHIVDREVYKMPPSPAFRAEGEYTENTSGKLKQFRKINVWVRLYGSRNVDQNNLIAVAAKVAMGKCQTNLGNPIKGKAIAVTANIGNLTTLNPLHTDFYTKVWMYENIVEFGVSTLANLSPVRFVKVPGWAGDPIIYTPLSDGVDPVTNTPGYTAYGTGDIFLRAAGYWDPTLATQNATLVPGDSIVIGDSIVSPTPSTGRSPLLLNPGLEPGLAGLTPEK